jgi:hypothetical protein
MPQFAVYRNRNEATRAQFPLLLDVQSDLLEPLYTPALNSRKCADLMALPTRFELVLQP